MEYILIVISAVFINNVVLAQYLGVCPFLGVSNKVNTALGMAGAVVFVIVLATMVTYLIQTYACPCGFHNHPEKECMCSPGMVQKYLNRISGPLLDRIDIHIEVVPVNYDKLADTGKTEKSAIVRQRVEMARAVQSKRFESVKGVYANSQMSASMQRKFCQLDEAGGRLLKTAMELRGLSARAYDRILKVGRTIADLGESENITVEHISEAINYRNLDREGWAG